MNKYFRAGVFVAVCALTLTGAGLDAEGTSGSGHDDYLVTVCRYYDKFPGFWLAVIDSKNNWNKRDGHKNDFLVTADTPCPPDQDGIDGGGGEDESDTTDGSGNNGGDTGNAIVVARGAGGGCMNCTPVEEEVEMVVEMELDQELEETSEVSEVVEGGEVLGASCGALLSSYLREGGENPVDQVIALQTFLNAELGASLPVTGVFDGATSNLVKAFQVKYWEDILAPWVPFGLPTAQTPTGYVFKTTLWKINMINCPTLELAVPELS